jgi:hypothetical protein
VAFTGFLRQVRTLAGKATVAQSARQQWWLAIGAMPL